MTECRGTFSLYPQEQGTTSCRELVSLQSSYKMILLFPFGGIEILIASGLKQRRNGSPGSCLGNASVSLPGKALV